MDRCGVPRTIAWVVLGSSVLLAIGSCSLTLGFEDYGCAVDSDCVQDDTKVSRCVERRCILATPASVEGGGGADGAFDAPPGDSGQADDPFACASRILPSPSSPGTGTVVSFPIFVQDIGVIGIAPASLVGATVSQCALTDPLCATPLFSDVTKAAGVKLTTNVSNGAFFRASYAGYLDSYNYLNVPLPGLDVGTVGLGIPVVTEANLNTLVSLGGIARDPALGVVLAIEAGCAGSYYDARAGGVAFDLPTAPAARSFYIRDGVPSLDGGTQTGVGVGGFLNVPLGAQRIVARRLDDNRTVASGSFVVLQKSLTVISLRPGTPAP